MGCLLLLRPYGPLILQLLDTNRLSWLQDSYNEESETAEIKTR